MEGVHHTSPASIFLAFSTTSAMVPTLKKAGFRILVHLAVHNGGKALDGVLQRDIDAGDAGELFGHVGGLGQKALDLGGPG